MSDNFEHILKLRNLLFQTSDIYHDWYAYCLKKLTSSEGLNLKGHHLDLSDAYLEVPRKNLAYSSYFSEPAHLGVKKLTLEDISAEFLYYRKYFPMILFFPSDNIRVSRDNKNNLNVKLVQKGVERILMEQSLSDFESNRRELITRLSSSIRTYPIDLSKVLENLEIKFPDLKEKELWDWLNQQDMFLFWGQLPDLQNYFEAYCLIKSPNSNFYYISLFNDQVNEIKYLMGQ